MSQTQTHADSIDEQDPDHEVQKKTKSRRPASTISLLRLAPIKYLRISWEHTDKGETHRHCLPATAIESMAVSVPKQAEIQWKVHS